MGRHSAQSVPSLHSLDLTITLIPMRIRISINTMFRKRPRRQPLSEHNIQLLIRSSLRLRKTEERPNEKDQCASAPEEARLAFPITRSGVQHIRVDNVGEDLRDVVADASQTHTLTAQTRG